jgi:hypothetical protein
MTWYALIDCAQDERLIWLVRACRQRVCLFAGDISLELQAASPWLVQMDEADALPATWRDQGLGQNWGIMCESALPLMDLRRHFRRFLQAKLPDGTIALFRFYDPRVLTTYLQAATPEERAPWFACVEQFWVEAAGVMHKYRLSEGGLVYGASS